MRTFLKNLMFGADLKLLVPALTQLLSSMRSYGVIPIKGLLWPIIYVCVLTEALGIPMPCNMLKILSTVLHLASS